MDFAEYIKQFLDILYIFFKSNFFSGIIGALVGSYITNKLTIRRDLVKDTRDRSLEIFKLSSELLRETNLFLASQKHFCENYEEYKEREYYNNPFHPLEKS